MKVDLLHKIGIIGFGNMGSVIAHKLAAQSDEYEVRVFEKDKGKTVKAGRIIFSESLLDLISKVDTLVLAIKPQDFDRLLKELRGHVPGKLVISIAAGISTKHIEKILDNCRVIRVMPNIAARIAESVTCICKGNFANEDDLE